MQKIYSSNLFTIVFYSSIYLLIIAPCPHIGTKHHNEEANETKVFHNTLSFAS
jgi:hypothetical protein